MGSLSGLVGLFILVLILATLMPVKYGDIDINQSLDILKNTQGNITLKFQVNETQTPVVKVVYKFVDFVIYSSFEVAELGIILGNEHLRTRGIYLLFWLFLFIFSIFSFKKYIFLHLWQNLKNVDLPLL